jgi:hypothetical protein
LQSDGELVYYYNTETQETAWSLPQQAADGEYSNNTESFIRRGDWLQQFDGEGNEYWLNEVTGESVWELPADDLQQSSTYSASTASSASAGGYTIDL